MNTVRKAFILPILAAICLFGIVCAPATNGPSSELGRNLAEVAPEDVGISAERLNRLSGAMQGLVDEGKLAGIVTMVARHGKLAHFETFGYQEISSSTPMAKDSIFRIYSMSKPITGVALMTLYEEGKFRLSDPVVKYIPEFADLMVVSGGGKMWPTWKNPITP